MKMIFTFSEDELSRLGVGKLTIKEKVHIEGLGEVVSIQLNSVEIDLKKGKFSSTQNYEGAFKEASKETSDLSKMEEKAKIAIRAEDNALMR